MYGEIMKEYPHPGGILHEEEQATKFMPFAGTEGYNPVAYAPYVLAEGEGRRTYYSAQLGGLAPLIGWMKGKLG